jgi:hypothetical protein
MPAALIPLISVIVGAAGVGTSIYEGVQSSDQASDAQKAQQQALLKQQQAQANQANLTKQEAVLGAQGQSQEQTGGSLTDSGTAALTDLLAGYPGYQSGSGTSTGTGVGSSGVSGANAGAPGSAGSPDIASILAALRNGGGGSGLGLSGPGAPGNLSGGNWQSQPAVPQNQFELANPLV